MNKFDSNLLILIHRLLYAVFIHECLWYKLLKAMNILHWCCSRPNILAVTLEFLWVFMSWLHFTFNAVSRVCNLLYSMNWLGCRLFELSAVTSLVLPRDGARLSRKVQRGHLVVPHILWMGPWGSPIMFNNALGCQGQYHFFPFFWDCWSYNHDQCFFWLFGQDEMVATQIFWQLIFSQY
jgi:hypothetical protein